MGAVTWCNFLGGWSHRVTGITSVTWVAGSEYWNLRVPLTNTLELISWNYWWPHMSWFMREYCNACNLCLWTKVHCHQPIRELHPLPVPENQWDVVSVNFITKLPELHGYDAVMVVVDSTGKHGHFIPTHTIVTALGSMWLYLQQVWKLHGLPLSVLSDHGSQFVLQFMCELYHILNIKIAASTAYHPQMDGQTEHVNQELEQYLHIFVNERQVLGKH